MHLFQNILVYISVIFKRTVINVNEFTQVYVTLHNFQSIVCLMKV